MGEVGGLLAAVAPDRVRVVDSDLEGREVGGGGIADRTEARVEPNQVTVRVLKLLTGLIKGGLRDGMVLNHELKHDLMIWEVRNDRQSSDDGYIPYRQRQQ